MAAEWKKNQEASDRKASEAVEAARRECTEYQTHRSQETSAYMDAIADFKALYEREQSLRVADTAKVQAMVRCQSTVHVRVVSLLGSVPCNGPIFFPRDAGVAGTAGAFPGCCCCARATHDFGTPPLPSLIVVLAPVLCMDSQWTLPPVRAVWSS